MIDGLMAPSRIEWGLGKPQKLDPVSRIIIIIIIIVIIIIMIIIIIIIIIIIMTSSCRHKPQTFTSEKSFLGVHNL